MSRYHRYNEQEEQDGGVVTPLEAETETEWIQEPRSILLNMTCDPTIGDDYASVINMAHLAVGETVISLTSPLLSC